MSHKRMHTW